MARRTQNGGAVSKLAFIGLGVMGFPMAGHLVARGGHDVTVYNRSRAKAEAWVAKHKGRVAETPAKAAEGAEIVFCCVGDDPDLREVTLGSSGAFQEMAKGAIFVDHTTASAKVARELSAEAKKRGFEFLDAPVSGGQAGAENGQLTVMVGGEPAAFERAKPAIAHFAKAVTLLGPSGAGQLTKMVNQICIAGLVQGLSEGLNFALKAGLDAKLVLDVISKGAAQSWQMENRGKTMVDDKFDFGFAVDWMRKDLRICSETAKQNGAQLPVTQTVAGFYDEISKMGGGRWDTSSLIRRLRRS
ncbi:MAG TPA: NAD(P)-dependent oxidoreductase [Burkholderiales bacterium]|nr:NAD(P)-dependent oxidoreductase [Burkholderiales bacterium]